MIIAIIRSLWFGFVGWDVDVFEGNVVDVVDGVVDTEVDVFCRVGFVNVIILTIGENICVT